jgi:hypothetical protein
VIVRERWSCVRWSRRRRSVFVGLDPVELTGNEEASIDLAVVQMLVRRMAGPPGKNQADSEAGSQDEGEERDERGGPEASEA